jgi:hypothetical protein
MKRLEQKIVGVLLIAALVLPVVFFHPKKASAQPIPVIDNALNAAFDAFASSLLGQLTFIYETEGIGLMATSLETAVATGVQTIKEVGPVSGLNVFAYEGGLEAPGAGLLSVDGKAKDIANLTLNLLVNDIVSWINSGFQGQPAFMSDPGDYFLNIADSIAGDFIESIPELEFLCDPFKLELDASLLYQYQDSGFQFRSACRLTEVLNNIENFTAFVGDSSTGQSADFLAGGWSGWISLANQNQYSSFIEAKAELSARIAGRKNIELLQLEWGSGFLSFQECINPPGAKLHECIEKGPIKTPGAIIEEGLGKALGTSIDDLQLADGFDRILNALMNQLIVTALGASGLSGYNPPPPDPEEPTPGLGL